MSPARSARRKHPKRPKLAKPPALPYQKAIVLAERLQRALRGADVVAGMRGRAVVFAGSLRRKKPLVGDLDVLLVDRTDEQWAKLEHVRGLQLTQFGPKKARGVYTKDRRKLQVDLRRVAKRSLGAALEYFTGPRGHNLGMRTKAKKRGWKLNEYGLYDAKGHRIAGRTEKSIYDALGYKWKRPEFRGGKTRKNPDDPRQSIGETGVITIPLPRGQKRHASLLRELRERPGVVFRIPMTKAEWERFTETDELPRRAWPAQLRARR